MQYALAASQEALDDAGWHPESEHDKEMTVNIILFYSLSPDQSQENRESVWVQALEVSKKYTTQASPSPKV